MNRRVVPVSDIIIGPRIRREVGDIGGLAASIQIVGLLNPPVVTPGLELVAGFRRLTALKFLGWCCIEVRIGTEEMGLEAEVHENEFRKDFSISEIYHAGKQIEADAVARGVDGRVRDVVARHLRIGSGRTWDRVKRVFESGDQDLIRRVCAGELDVTAAARSLAATTREANRKEKANPVRDLPAIEMRETAAGVEVTLRSPHPLLPGGCVEGVYRFRTRVEANFFLVPSSRIDSGTEGSG